MAARLVEEELAKGADGKAPEDKPLTRAEREAIKQRPEEKGQKPLEGPGSLKAERECEPRKAKTDLPEQAGIDKHSTKKGNCG